MYLLEVVCFVVFVDKVVDIQCLDSRLAIWRVGTVVLCERDREHACTLTGTPAHVHTRARAHTFTPLSQHTSFGKFPHPVVWLSASSRAHQAFLILRGTPKPKRDLKLKITKCTFCHAVAEPHWDFTVNFAKHVFGNQFGNCCLYIFNPGIPLSENLVGVPSQPPATP